MEKHEHAIHRARQKFGSAPGSDTDQTTNMTYDGDGDSLTATAIMPNTGNSQTTAYLYNTGSTGNLYSNNLLSTVEHPDLTTGNASSSSSNDQAYTYDNLGEPATYTDQNGTVQQYTRDVLGRTTLDAGTTIGSGVGSYAVQSLGYSYTPLDQLYQATSFASATGTSIVNQVQDNYNGLGQVVAEYQAHSGAVSTGSTPSVQYGFSSAASGSVPASLTHVGGQTVDYGYGGQSDISSMSWCSTTSSVTVTTTSPMGVLVGTPVTISGVPNTLYDGPFTVTGVSGSTFTYSQTSSPGTFSAGTDMTATGEAMVPLSGISWSGTTVTASLINSMPASTSFTVTISGASPSTLDGTFTATVATGGMSVTYTDTALSGSGTATGVDLTMQSATPTLDGTIGRLTMQQDHAAIAGAYNTAGGVVEAYTYLGLGTIVQQTRPQVNSDLSLIQQYGDTLASGAGGDRYTGLDQWGEVIDQNWVNPTTVASTDRFQYKYDADSNVLYKNNLQQGNESELYGYDGLNRITSFLRGTLSSGTILALNVNLANNSDETWTLDALGNWTSTGAAAGTGTSSYPTLTATSHTNNSQNELTGIGSSTLTYNNDGQTTVDASDENYTYDAFGNEMTYSCASGCTCGASMSASYDALGREITEADSNASSGITQGLYYSTDGQVLDDVTPLSVSTTCGTSCCGGSSYCYCCTVTTVEDKQQDWSAGYVGDLVLRDDVTTVTTTFLNETACTCSTSACTIGTRLYAQQDANYNVTSLVAPTGGGASSVVERFVYDPYGTQQVLDPTTWNAMTEAYHWVYGFQGGRINVATGTEKFGARDYSASDGRWLQADPAGYVDGMNYYQAMGSNPVTNVDPTGFFKSDVHAQLTNEGGTTSGVNPDALEKIIAADIHTDLDLGDNGTARNFNYHAQKPGWENVAQYLMHKIVDFDCAKDSLDSLTTAIGQLLHILQDFYSHTDFVEGSQAMLPLYPPGNSLRNGVVVPPSKGATLNLDDLYYGGSIPLVHYYIGGSLPFVRDSHNSFAADNPGFGRDAKIQGAYQRAYQGAAKQTSEAFAWIRNHMKSCCISLLFDQEGDFAPPSGTDNA